MFREGMYVMYGGRVCVVDYIDEYGMFLRDVDRDEMIMVSVDDFDKVVDY